MDGLDLLDQVVAQAFNYVDRFNQSNGLLIHLNEGSIKKKDMNES